jgi:hypothetical protein
MKFLNRELLDGFMIKAAAPLGFEWLEPVLNWKTASLMK